MSGVLAPSALRLPTPWLERNGRFSPFRAAVFAACFVPAIAIVVQWSLGWEGTRPLIAVIHQTGLWTVRLLLITLAISPAKALLSWNRLLVVRRMLGVATMTYGLGHITLYIASLNWDLVRAGGEIVHRFYLVVGFTALSTLVALGVTSTDSWVRRLGRGWGQLHRLVYPAALLGLFHFFMQAKSDVGPAVFYAGLLAWLLAWRGLPRRMRGRFWVACGLGLFAPIAATGVEYAWFSLATHIDPVRVLRTEFAPYLQPRALAKISIAAVLATAAIGVRHLVRASGKARALAQS